MLKQSSKKKKELGILRNLWDSMKHNYICTTGIPEESEQGIKNPFKEIMTKNFPNMVKEKDTQVQEVQKVPNKIDPKRPAPRHIKLK